MKLRRFASSRLLWQSYGFEILFCVFESGAATWAFKMLCSQIFEQSTSAAVGRVASPESVHQNHTHDLASSDESCQHKTLVSEPSFSDNPYGQPEVSTIRNRSML